MKDDCERKTMIFTGKELFALVLPLVLEQLLGLTVGMADSVMVSSAGEAAVSGVSLVDSIGILLINTFASISTGGAVVAAHHLGEKKEKDAVRTANQLLLLVTAIAVFIMALSLIFNQWLLERIFGSIEEDVMRNAVIYFYITAVSYPFLAIYNASAALTRAMGDSRTTMKISIWMNVINIVGNAVLIPGFHAGVYGVAFSTLFSRMFGAVVIFRIMCRIDRKLHYGRPIFCPMQWRIIRRILKIGIPTGIDSCIFQIGKILVQSLIASLGTVAIAANAIVGVVAGVAVVPASAMGIAMITVIGQALGANEWEQAKAYIKKLMSYAYLFMAILNIAIILLAPKIAGLYQVSDDVLRLAEQVIIFHSICAALFWPTGFALPNALRAAMDVNFTMWVSIGCMWICRIGCSYLFVRGFHMGLFGIWAAMAVDWVVRSVLFLWRIKSGRWIKQMAEAKNNSVEERK